MRAARAQAASSSRSALCKFGRYIRRARHANLIAKSDWKILVGAGLLGVPGGPSHFQVNALGSWCSCDSRTPLLECWGLRVKTRPAGTWRVSRNKIATEAEIPLWGTIPIGGTKLQGLTQECRPLFFSVICRGHVRVSFAGEHRRLGRLAGQADGK